MKYLIAFLAALAFACGGPDESMTDDPPAVPIERQAPQEPPAPDPQPEPDPQPNPQPSYPADCGGMGARCSAPHSPDGTCTPAGCSAFCGSRGINCCWDRGGTEAVYCQPGLSCQQGACQ